MRAGNPNFGKAIAGLSVGILLSFLAIHGACADTIQPKTGAAPTNDTQPQPFAHPWRVAQNLLNGDDSLLKPGTTPAPAPASPAPNAPAGGGDLLNGGGLLQGAPANGQVFTGKPAAPAAAPAAQGEQAEPAKKSADGDTAHGELFAKSVYPSAIECSECHPKQFREWAVSSHAYAQLSPIFNAFQRTVNVAFNGSNGDFCFRCHTQVGTALSEFAQYSQSAAQRSLARRHHLHFLPSHRRDLQQDQRPSLHRERADNKSGLRPDRQQRTQTRPIGLQRLSSVLRPGQTRAQGSWRYQALRADQKLDILWLLPRRHAVQRLPTRRSIQRIPHVAGGGQRHDLPGLPYGQSSGAAGRI